MALAYVNVGAITRSTGVTSRSPALPASLVSGNILFAICFSANNASHTWSGTGWTKIGANINAGASFTASIGWRIVDGTEAAPTISWTGSANAAACMWQLSGSASSPALTNLNSNSGNTSTHSVTGITGSASGSWALYLDVAIPNTAIATPSGWTEDNDVGNTTTVSCRFTLGHKLVDTGSSGNISVTGAATAWAMWCVELEVPAVSSDTHGLLAMF